MSIEDDIRRIVREELDKCLAQTDWPTWVTIYRAPEYHPTQRSTVSTNVTCSTCGLVWKGAMGYCCPRLDCPMGAGPMTSTTTNIDGVKLS